MGVLYLSNDDGLDNNKEVAKKLVDELSLTDH